MSLSIQLPATSVPGCSVNPLKADGTPSFATLSNVVFSSSDTTVFTVASDPANTPNGFIITVIGTTAGSGTVSATATATEPDGVTTEVIAGSDTVSLVAAPPPPAALLGFSFGTPQ